MFVKKTPEYLIHEVGTSDMYIAYSKEEADQILEALDGEGELSEL